MKCITDGCVRESRSKRRPGRCNTCYWRLHKGIAPKFPADPLLAYMAAKGKGWPRTGRGTVR